MTTTPPRSDTPPRATSLPTSPPRIVVVKIGGAALDQPFPADPATGPDIWACIARLHERLRSEPRVAPAPDAPPAGVVLVHGGGAALDRQFQRLGIQSDRREGLRITPDEHMPDVVSILAGVTNLDVARRLRAAGARAVGICLADAFLTSATRAADLGFDAGAVGRVTSGDPALVCTLLAAGFLPVISPIAEECAPPSPPPPPTDPAAPHHLRTQPQCSTWNTVNPVRTNDATSSLPCVSFAPLNVNADDAAAAIAAILHASTLCLMTDVPGVYDESGTVVSELSTADVEPLIARGVFRSGMIPKARAAARAAAIAGADVRVLSWKHPGALLGLVENPGAVPGTRVVCPR